MEHDLSAVFAFDVDCIGHGVEPLPVDFLDVLKVDGDVVKHFVFECLDAHVVEGLPFVFGLERDGALLGDADYSLHDGEHVDVEALSGELFELFLLGFLIGGGLGLVLAE